MKIWKTKKILRTSKGLTQNQMSRLLSISQNYLSLIEQDKKVPSGETVQVFATSLNIWCEKCNKKIKAYFCSKGFEKDLINSEVEEW